MTGRHLTSALAVLLALTTARPAPAGDSARAWLASLFDLGTDDLARIDGGEVFSRTVPAADRREVATLGVVRVRITPEYYVEQFGDIASFKQDDAVLQIGGFSNPPTVADVAALTLDESDIDDLRGCKVGDCGMQLSPSAIDRFRREVDWRRHDASSQANQVMRQVLVDYATGYLEGGAAFPAEYADDDERLDVRKEFASLAESRPLAWHEFPHLLRHLVEFPGEHRPRQVRDLLYWSKEKVGRRTVVSITHLAAVPTSNDPGLDPSAGSGWSRATSRGDYAIGSKQVYGTHYFDASLGLTVLIRDRAASTPVTYVAYFNRSRVDVFHGLFGGITRAAVTSRARSTVAGSLERLKRRLEQQFTAPPS